MFRKIDPVSFRLTLLQRHLDATEYEAEWINNFSAGAWVNYSSAEMGWGLWFHISELTTIFSPQLTGMILNEKAMRHILSLSSFDKEYSLSSSVSIPLHRLKRSDLVDENVIKDKTMLRVKRNSLSYYIECCPLLSFDKLSKLPEWINFPFPVSVTIGYSTLSLSALRALRRGDILVVKIINKRMLYLNNSFPLKSLGENFMIDEDRYMATLSELYQDNNTDIIDDISKLPVQVDVILHHCQLTLEELQQIRQSKMFPLPDSVHENVRIQVNGQTFALGELVEFDQQLAVEIRDISVGVEHD